MPLEYGLGAGTELRASRFRYDLNAMGRMKGESAE